MLSASKSPDGLSKSPEDAPKGTDPTAAAEIAHGDWFAEPILARWVGGDRVGGCGFGRRR
jgi:hypothetical protein